MVTMEGNKERDYSVLLKPFWYPCDIEKFLGCSHNTAVKIKNEVAYLYKETELSKLNSKNKSVKRDDVIKYLGGVDGVTEAKIYSLLKGER